MGRISDTHKCQHIEDEANDGRFAYDILDAFFFYKICIENTSKVQFHLCVSLSFWRFLCAEYRQYDVYVLHTVCALSLIYIYIINIFFISPD